MLFLHNPEFSPLEISSLHLWLDGSDTSTITKDGSNNISQWFDKSGNAHHALQATGANQPLHTSNHVADKSVVTFDGTNEQMDLASTVSLANDFTMFFVANNEDVVQARVYLGHTVDNTLLATLSGLAFSRIANGLGNDFTQPYPAQGITNIETLRRDSANKIDQAFNGAAFTRIYSDIAQVGTSNWNLIGTGSGGGINWFGDIAEILIYNRAVSSEERENIEDYLSRKWNISI